MQCTYINPTSWDWSPTITVQGKGWEREFREANILPGKKGGMIIHHHPRKDHWGAKWEGAWTHRWANYKVLHKCKAWVSHWNLTTNTIFLRLPRVFAVVYIMIHPGSVWATLRVCLGGTLPSIVWVYRLTEERRGRPRSPKEVSHPDPNPPKSGARTWFCSGPQLPEQPWFWVIPQPSDPMSTGVVEKEVTP